MKDNIVHGHFGAIHSPEQVRAVHEFDRQITAALQAAVDAAVPHGYIVAILHGHALRETQEMMQFDD